MRTIKRIAPLQAGKILGILYFALGVVLVPFILIVGFIGSHAAPHPTAFPAIFGAGFAVMAPIFYGVMGFIGGVISAALYNLAARFVGGVEVEVE